MSKSCNLSDKHCVPCEGGVDPLTSEQVQKYLEDLSDWNSNDDHTIITKTFMFKGYYKTIAFVNAIAWIAQAENHHPDLEVSYNKCIVHFSTHAINGLSENDFICATKVENLIKA